METSPLPISSQFLDLRVAVLGNVDSGKSTLLGVLTQGELDNGRGRARLNLFRHLHEIQSGRTSSISFEILGFNSKGEVHGLNGTQWGQTVEDGLGAGCGDLLEKSEGIVNTSLPQKSK